MLLCRIGWHKWEKWQQYVRDGVVRLDRGEKVEVDERRQYRLCELCGKEQNGLVHGYGVRSE